MMMSFFLSDFLMIPSVVLHLQVKISSYTLTALSLQLASVSCNDNWIFRWFARTVTWVGPAGSRKQACRSVSGLKSDLWICLALFENTYFKSPCSWFPKFWYSSATNAEDVQLGLLESDIAVCHLMEPVLSVQLNLPCKGRLIELYHCH